MPSKGQADLIWSSAAWAQSAPNVVGNYRDSFTTSC